MYMYCFESKQYKIGSDCCHIDQFIVSKGLLQSRVLHTESRYVVLKPPFKHAELILHLSSFAPAVLVLVIHMVSTKKSSDATLYQVLYKRFSLFE